MSAKLKIITLHFRLSLSNTFLTMHSMLISELPTGSQLPWLPALCSARLLPSVPNDASKTLVPADFSSAHRRKLCCLIVSFVSSNSAESSLTAYERSVTVASSLVDKAGKLVTISWSRKAWN